MLCPNCRVEVSESKRFCGRCGAPLNATPSLSTPSAVASRQCSKCVAEVPPDKNFCRGCGTPLATPPTPAPRVLSDEGTPPLASRSISSQTPPTESPEAALPAPVQRDPSDLASRTTLSNRPTNGPSGRMAVTIAALVIFAIFAAVWYSRGVEIDLVTNPGGAAVVWDGKPLGRTADQGGELILPHLTRGNHTLSLTRTGFGEWVQPVALGWFELSHPLKVALPGPALPKPVGNGPSDVAKAQPEAIPNDIGLFLQTWRNSFLAGNFDAHMECYAPLVETYYQKRNLTRAGVRREREGMIAQYGNVRQFDVSNIELTTTAQGHVEVRFRTHWELSGKAYFAGEDTEKLTLTQTGGRWLITGEEEPAVYWVKKQPQFVSVKPNIDQLCKDPGNHDKPCPESAPSAGSSSAAAKESAPANSTVLAAGDPAKTVLDAFDAYIAGNTAGVTNLMSDEGARNMKTYCHGDAASCLRSNYNGLSGLESRSAGVISRDAASARVRLMSNWKNPSGRTTNAPQCQTYDLSLSGAGWRINSFSLPVPKSCQ